MCGLCNVRVPSSDGVSIFTFSHAIFSFPDVIAVTVEPYLQTSIPYKVPLFDRRNSLLRKGVLISKVVCNENRGKFRVL